MYQAARSISLEVLGGSADIPIRRFVTYEATNGLALPDAAGDAALIAGITLEAYDDSEADLGNASSVLPVAPIDGAILEVEAGQALAVGATVIAGNDGRAMVSTTTAGSNITAGAYQNLGKVVKAAGAAGGVASIVAFRGAIVTAA